MKLWKRIEKQWKNQNFKYFVLGIIATLIITFIVIPIVSNLLEPTKAIAIYETSAQHFNLQDTKDLLENFSRISNIQAVAGCSQIYFILHYDLEGKRAENDEVFTGLNGEALEVCPNCTAYSTVFFSEDSRNFTDIEISAKLRDNDTYFEKKDIGVNVIPYESFPGRNGFKVEIEKIYPKDEDMVLLTWRTLNYNKVEYDCSISKKQKCNIIKSKIAVITDRDTIEETLNMIRPDNWLDIAFTKELKYYQFDPTTWTFIPDNGNPLYRIIKGTCPQNSSSENIDNVMLNVNFSN